MLIAKHFPELLLRAATAVLEAKRALWQVEQEKLDKLLKTCHFSHHTPPDNYWQAEHRARHDLERSILFLEAIMEVQEDEKQKRSETHGGVPKDD